MNLGDWEDTRRLEVSFGKDELIDALKNAEAGWFTPRIWNFWHYRLGSGPERKRYAQAAGQKVSVSTFLKFQPRTEIFPDSQREVWSLLKPAVKWASRCMAESPLRYILDTGSLSTLTCLLTVISMKVRFSGKCLSSNMLR